MTIGQRYFFEKYEVCNFLNETNYKILNIKSGTSFGKYSANYYYDVTYDTAAFGVDNSGLNSKHFSVENT
jgi:hypothetical protein